jgi:hypothetical protein
MNLPPPLQPYTLKHPSLSSAPQVTPCLPTFLNLILSLSSLRYLPPHFYLSSPLPTFSFSHFLFVILLSLPFLSDADKAATLNAIAGAAFGAAGQR